EAALVEEPEPAEEAALAEEPESAEEAALIEEPEPEEEAALVEEPEEKTALVEEPEPVEEQDDFSDTSETLLNPEDALEEYNDSELKSVDELLNELQQVEDESYVETPEWSTEDLDDEIEEVEVDLGDDPLADEAEPEPSLEDEILDTSNSEELVESSEQELDDTPLLEADNQLPSHSDELESDNLEDDVKDISPSQTEQDLASALSAGNDLDNLDDDFDDELLIDNDFAELDNELEGAEEIQPLDLNDSQETALDEQTSATAEPLQEDDLDDDLLIDELAEQGSELENELDDDELANTPPTALNEEIADLPENVDTDTKDVSVSQTEQDLANALAAESSLDSLEDDFDD
ncbi:hypothetical protein H5156_20325, partial [Pseudoalteromonas sp. SG41-6]|nr:hypothetical protein [Pseudoalteromonas sp. SG41-6]